MKFFAIIALALSAVASAELTQVVKRQQPDVASPAMTDANGNIITFDAANVYNDMAAKGL